MQNVELYDTQLETINRMHNGCCLMAPVGAGKSRTAIAYVYLKELQGDLRINSKGKYHVPRNPRDLYIITTAKKRDSREWDDELIPFNLSSEKDIAGVRVTIDSWNNLHKYVNVYGAAFIFDEQKISGKGAWVKAFLKITKKNRWILLSWTPGDTYSDYIPLFIANGYFKNRTDFNIHHVIFKPYFNYPVVDHYVNTGILNKYRNQILVKMDAKRSITKHWYNVKCIYDTELYKTVWKDRWNPYDNCPIEETGKLCYLMRRVTNCDESRFVQLKKVLDEHPKVIIFYNFTPELEALREHLKKWGIKEQEWNGERHEVVPSGDSWAYLCQYNGAAEGWSCITTDTLIFFSLNYSYKMMVQAAGRIDRTNTPFEELYYYRFRSTSPIDRAINKALSQKKDFNERAFLGV